ncbi:PhnE/PtxC family ABC transporter permease [Gemmiger formicilis]|uniref:PhnE/PtxC family ABC transporter permease n=1 Tax=Gemmiger formicilis TaxID=745368 RepID=UPI0031F653DA
MKEHCKIIDWGKMLSRVPDIGVVFWNLAHLDFSNMDLVFSSLVETVSIAVLSLLYSLVLGILFGMLAARNVFRLPVLAVATQSFFTFLRAIPTPVWVLLMLVCLGMGPEAGVAGLCVHTTAFFTKSFAQSFESIPEETVESLEVTGASRLSIFSLNDTIKDISATEGGRAVMGDMGELMAMVGMGAGSSGMGGVPLAVGAAAAGMACGGGSQGSKQKRSRALPSRESPAPYLTAKVGRNQ